MSSAGTRIGGPSVSRPRILQASLHIRNISDGKLLSQARACTESVAANKTKFPLPSPSLETMTSLITAFEKACVLCGSGGRSSFPLKEAAKRSLSSALVMLGNYVTLIANHDPDQAAAIITAAGMDIRKKGRISRPDFSMRPGKNAGELLLRSVSVPHRFTMRFEICPAAGPKDAWMTVQHNSRCSAKVTGLVSGTRYFARVFRTDKTGTHQVGIILDCFVP